MNGAGRQGGSGGVAAVLLAQTQGDALPEARMVASLWLWVWTATPMVSSTKMKSPGEKPFALGWTVPLVSRVPLPIMPMEATRSLAPIQSQ